MDTDRRHTPQEYENGPRLCWTHQSTIPTECKQNEKWNCVYSAENLCSFLLSIFRYAYKDDSDGMGNVCASSEQKPVQWPVLSPFHSFYLSIQTMCAMGCRNKLPGRRIKSVLMLRECNSRFLENILERRQRAIKCEASVIIDMEIIRRGTRAEPYLV